MMQRTRAITQRYLGCPSTIVVVVVPANSTRVRDSQAMQLVQAAGKEAMTLGVFAKADLAHDPRYKQRKQKSPYWELKERLLGVADDTVKLPNGWVAVKNRDTLVEEEEEGGLAESSTTEREWFSKEAKLPLESCGIDSLVLKIDKLFTDHIRNTWAPQATTHLQHQSSRVAAKIEQLGQSPTSLSLEEVLVGFVDGLNSAEVERFIAGAVYNATMKVFVDDAALKNMLSVFDATLRLASTPSLQFMVVKRKLESAMITLFSEAKIYKQVCADVIALVFKNGTGLPVLLNRFEVLRDALAQIATKNILVSQQDFAAAAAGVIRRCFQFFSGRSRFVVSEFTEYISRCLSELALEMFFVPLVTNPSNLAEQLRSATKQAGKKAKQASFTDENLLVESCAASRTELVASLHSIYVALEETKAI